MTLKGGAPTRGTYNRGTVFELETLGGAGGDTLPSREEEVLAHPCCLPEGKRGSEREGPGPGDLQTPRVGRGQK